MRPVVVDLLGALAGLLVLLMPPAVLGAGGAFASAAAGVIAIMAAIVTFGCGLVYQSQAPAVRRMRAQFGAELKRIWSWNVGCVLACSIAALAAILIIPMSSQWGLAIAFGSLGASLMSTLRSVRFIEAALAAHAIDPADRDQRRLGN